jgi:hypothetical protein
MVIEKPQNAGSSYQPNFEFLKEWAVIHKIDIGKAMMNMFFMKVLNVYRILTV